MFFCIPALAERGPGSKVLHLATRFAFFQVMHDLRVLLIQAVKQQGDNDDYPQEERTVEIDVVNHVDSALRLNAGSAAGADVTRHAQQAGDNRGGNTCTEFRPYGNRRRRSSLPV